MEMIMCVLTMSTIGAAIGAMTGGLVIMAAEDRQKERRLKKRRRKYAKTVQTASGKSGSKG